jgi:hypothetical protein
MAISEASCRHSIAFLDQASPLGACFRQAAGLELLTTLMPLHATWKLYLMVTETSAAYPAGIGLGSRRCQRCAAMTTQTSGSSLWLRRPGIFHRRDTPLWATKIEKPANLFSPKMASRFIASLDKKNIASSDYCPAVVPERKSARPVGACMAISVLTGLSDGSERSEWKMAERESAQSNRNH